MEPMWFGHDFMKKPLIAINGRFLTQEITGAQRYAQEMVDTLLKNGGQYRYQVIAPRGRLLRRTSGLLQDDSFWQGYLWEQIRLPRIAKKIKADLLWCPCNTAPIFTHGLPLVFSLMDASVFAGPEWFSPWFRYYYRFLLPVVARRARKVLTISKFSQEEITRYGIVRQPGDIQVIYCGISRFFLNSDQPKEDDGAPLNGKKFVLGVGSLDPRKNLRGLLQAWERLPVAVKQGRVLAIAGKKYQAFQDEELNPAADVSFLGYVSNQQLLSLYSRAEAFVYPSFYEGFGLPPLEAMACGTPTLVSQTASLPEVCGDAVIYCNPYDSADIANKLTQILCNQSLIRELRRKGPERARLFTWEKAAQQLGYVFEDILANKFQ
jgi:glycosyltransferase involved in cell wall biosynthesis